MSVDSDYNLPFRILRQEAGRFDRRLAIGPARWPHFDLLWVHEGEVQLEIGECRERVVLAAPAGILIMPDASFEGTTLTTSASASICHFEGGAHPSLQAGADFSLPNGDDVFHVQNLINLSLSYAERNVDMDVRARLLSAILDGFAASQNAAAPATRLDRAWRQAGENLSLIRSLTDVAMAIGLTESAFRALHKQQFGGSAGQYLRELRLAKAERLLATTGDTVASISNAVGYAQPESFSHAFSASRGRTPAAYRLWCKRFA
ncbi:MAG: helix-turn-helix domain-containing protein [Rhizobiaceae bacterium]|nr:helix-turn-helix domain-containing protein [Rhizobiaceae bacterium]